jgi:hypothetical protein
MSTAAVEKLEIRPDMDQVISDFQELRELSEELGFNLSAALDRLTNSLTPIWACDTMPAPGTNYLIARYKLAEFLDGALAALRIVARHRQRHL